MLPKFKFFPFWNSPLLPGFIIGLLVIFTPGNTLAAVIDSSRAIDWQGACWSAWRNS